MPTALISSVILVILLFAAGQATEVQATKDDSLDFTNLHSAAFFGDAEAVTRLLEAGADVNATEKDGQPPSTWPLGCAVRKSLHGSWGPGLTSTLRIRTAGLPWT